MTTTFFPQTASTEGTAQDIRDSHFGRPLFVLDPKVTVSSPREAMQALEEYALHHLRDRVSCEMVISLATRCSEFRSGDSLPELAKALSRHGIILASA